MRSHALLTAVGADRIGIVDDLSAAVLERKCNIEESRMALLGGDFAALVLVSGGEEAVSRLLGEAEAIGLKLGLSASARRTEGPAQKAEDLPYILESSSLDTSGIVHSVAAVLRRYGINIADLETETVPAPWTGAPLFNMRARISVPRSVSVAAVKRELEALENEHNLDLRLFPAGRGPADSF
jgi:glycine cleavage system transcriptional repressor